MASGQGKVGEAPTARCRGRFGKLLEHRGDDVEEEEDVMFDEKLAADQEVLGGNGQHNLEQSPDEHLRDNRQKIGEDCLEDGARLRLQSGA